MPAAAPFHGFPSGRKRKRGRAPTQELLGAQLFTEEVQLTLQLNIGQWYCSEAGCSF